MLTECLHAYNYVRVLSNSNIAISVCVEFFHLPSYLICLIYLCSL